jgi:hypothetical protein
VLRVTVLVAVLTDVTVAATEPPVTVEPTYTPTVVVSVTVVELVEATATLMTVTSPAMV